MNDYWFCFFKDNRPYRLHHSLPIWFCLSKQGHLKKISDDIISDKAMVVVYHKRCYINKVHINDKFITDFFAPEIKTAYSKDERLLSWDYNGTLCHVINGNYYYEFNELGICTRISNKDGDMKVYIDNHYYIAVINMLDYELEFNVYNDTLTEEMTEDLTDEQYYRLVSITRWRAFPTTGLNKRPIIFNSIINNNLFNIITDKNKYVFEIDTKVRLKEIIDL